MRAGLRGRKGVWVAEKGTELRGQNEGNVVLVVILTGRTDLQAGERVVQTGVAPGSGCLGVHRASTIY